MRARVSARWPGRSLLSLLSLGALVACSGFPNPAPVNPPTSSSSPPGTASPVTATSIATPTTIAPCAPPTFTLAGIDVYAGDSVELDASTLAYASGEPASGPNAVTIGPDGDVWIADTEAVRLGTPRLLQIGCDGPPGTIIDLAPHQVASVLDIVADAQGVWIADFDIAEDVQRVLRLDNTGAFVAEYPIPDGFRLFDGFTGLELTSDGTLLLEMIGTDTYDFVSPDGSAVDPPTPSTWVSHGMTVTVQNPDRAGSNEGAVVIGDVTVPIVTTHFLGGITWLGDGPDGQIYVVVDELYDGGVLEVDETVWRLSLEGAVTGKARVPVAERHLYLEHPLAIAPNGDVIVMVALEDTVVVTTLEFGADLQPALPPK